MVDEISAGNLFSIIGKSLIDGVFVVRDAQFIYASESMLRMFGFSNADDLLEGEWQRVFTNPAQIVRIIGKSSEVLPAHDTVRCLKADGTEFWAELYMRIEMQDGERLFVGLLRDVSESLEREMHIRKKNDDVRKLNIQLDKFLYSASHDFRQPLSSILGLVGLMRMEPQFSSGLHYLDKIENSVNTLDKFIKNVIEFTKNSHTRIRSERTDLCALVTASVHRLQSQPGAPPIRFSLEAGGDFAFYSDASRIASVIDQVLSNAWQFFDEEKPDPYVRVLITLRVDRAIVEIIDNGIGIGKTHIDRVCEMFYRASERSRGSGLGLYIVRETVQSLKGMVSIDSEVKLGTIVQISVPNAEKGILINRKRTLVLKN